MIYENIYGKPRFSEVSSEMVCFQCKERLDKYSRWTEEAFAAG
jgi:hypothetical protein